MTRKFTAAALLGGLVLVAGCSDDMMMSKGMDEQTVMVGGAPMYPSKTIVENAVNSADHTTLVAAVKAAGLVDTLNGPGPFTVFAPTNAAFEKLPTGTVDTLLEPANKPMLTKILTYHVVPGRVSEAELKAAIMAQGGTATLTTVAGDPLTAKIAPDNTVHVFDEQGNMAIVTTPDVFQSNGVIHVVDTVLLPE
ncbi:fasciclin domain-containing protein [Oceanicella sp. SM1341]|uniref:fasciclin domain-containing protein n=1 Tax=Oceanicella sp. SM1341 TaxID=1548889 RepID=UPI0035187575